MSTSFLVIQAQRDLAQAKQNELGAVLAYDLALVDFEALQEAGPAASVSATSGTSAPAAVSLPASTAVSPATAAGAAVTRATAIPGVPQ